MKIEDLITQASLGHTKFYDFTNGANIGDFEIERWIRKSMEAGAEYVRKNKPNDHFRTMSSGNTKILVEFYREEGGTYTVFVDVIKSYRHNSNCGVII